MRRLLLPILLLALAAPALVAGVRFESQRLVVKAGPDEDEVTADFPFTNDGPGAAKVVSVLSNCHCLLAEGPEGEVPAGGKGTVHSIFKIGSFNGLVEKHLVVRMEENGVPKDFPLVVAVEVPDVIKIEPPTLVWTAGEPAKEKTLRVLMVWPDPIRVLSVECSRPEFEFRVEVVREGREYAVHVKPLKPEEPLLGLIQIKTDCKFPKYRNPMGFVHIRRAPGQ
jgi:hypothetical protein